MHMRQARAVAVAIFALVMLVLSPPLARAHEYICKGVVTLVVPLPSGTTTDVQARYFAERLGRHIGRTITVLNLPGGQGAVAASRIATTQPDGCTIFVMINGVFAVAKLDPKEWSLISTFATSTLLYVVNPEIVPVGDLSEFAEWAKSRKVSIAASAGSAIISATIFARSLGSDAVSAPYTSENEGVQHVAAAQVCCGFAMYATTRGLVDSGKLKVLSVVSTRRSSLVPDIRTLVEAMPRLRFLAEAVAPMSFLLAPKGLPKDDAEYLSETVHAIAAEPETKRFFGDRGGELIASTPGELDAFLGRNIPAWKSVVEMSGIAPPK